MRGSAKCCPYLAAPKNMCAKLKGSLRIVFFAWKRASGAPGEIRTPDLLLRRLSQQLRSSQNQLLIFALVWRCAALSASTEHILNTILPRGLQGLCGGNGRASSSRVLVRADWLRADCYRVTFPERQVRLPGSVAVPENEALHLVEQEKGRSRRQRGLPFVFSVTLSRKRERQL